jgi:hypothetical protein
MNLNSSFREPGGLATHILHGPANEEIAQRSDLSVGSSLDVRLDVELFAALGHSRGIKKSLIHMMVSPSIALTADQERATIEKVRAIYNIPADHPVVVVQHTKPGAYDRPAHYHLVFPRVDQHTGRCISDKFSRVKNERISRELEIDFDHPQVVGKFNKSIHRALETERPDIAERVDPNARPPNKAAAQGVDEKQHAASKGADIAAFDREVLDAWTRGKGNAIVIAKALAAKSISLAEGDKTVMVVDQVTGFSSPLGRVINRETKRRGDALRVKDADVRRLFADQKPLAQVIAETLGRHLQQSRTAVASERILERQLCAIVGAVPVPPVITEKALPTRTTKPSQAAARREICDNFADAKRRRRRTVDLAWRRAGLFANRDARKMLALSASVTVLAIGAPIILAVGTFYVTSIALAIKRSGDVQRARTITAESKAADRTARAALQAQLAAVALPQRRRVGRSSTVEKPKPGAARVDRDLAGAAWRTIAQGSRRRERSAGRGLQASRRQASANRMANTALGDIDKAIPDPRLAAHRAMVATAAQVALANIIRQGRRAKGSELLSITDSKKPWVRLACAADAKGLAEEATKLAAFFGATDELQRVRAILADPACADNAELELVRAIPTWPKPDATDAAIASLRAAGAYGIAATVERELQVERELGGL